jgi:hypothetical protein
MLAESTDGAITDFDIEQIVDTHFSQRSQASRAKTRSVHRRPLRSLLLESAQLDVYALVYVDCCIVSVSGGPWIDNSRSVDFVYSNCFMNVTA